MNVLHVVAPAEYGGLERVVQALTRGHRTLGHSVSVAVVHQPGARVDAFASVLESGGVDVVPLSVEGRSYRREREMVARLCRQTRPDILHTHGYRPDVLLAGVARGLGIPHVTTVHGFTGGDWKNRFYETLQRRAYRRFSAVVAVSRRLADNLIDSGVPADRVHLLPNAWGDTSPPLPPREARAHLGLPPEGYRLGWVGRVSPEKGADVLLDALALLRDLPISASFLGDGSRLDELRARSQELGLGDRVCWHGAVSDAGSLFRAFDAYVLSSRTEGTPIALFEAVTAGVPVVATAVGGVPDVVSTSEALLVPSEDPKALAAAIREAWSRPEEARERAAAARDRVRREYALDPWLRSYLSLYQQICPPARTAELCQV